MKHLRLFEKFQKKLNQSDYRYFLEKIEEEIDDEKVTDENIKKFKRKFNRNYDKIIILKTDFIQQNNSYKEIIEFDSYWEDLDYYNFNGSSFFVVDEENKLAYYIVEPREYNSLEEYKEDTGNDVLEFDDIDIDDIDKFVVSVA